MAGKNSFLELESLEEQTWRVSLRGASSRPQRTEQDGARAEHCQLQAHLGLESSVGKTKCFRSGTSERYAELGLN